MMRRYPAYRDSGVEWLGEVPEHWPMKRLKNLFDLQKRPVREEDEIVTAFRDGIVTLRKNRREDGFTNALQEIGYQGIRQGDLVIHAMDGFAGAIGVSDSDGKSTPVYSVCKPSGDALSQYYGRLLRHMALSGFVTALARGVRERSTEFRWADASVLVLPVPPLPEQTAIAAFLDRETAKIDALVAEQRRLIDLLREKRQAVISHAVTKGLHPDAPMKPSGVDWLGDVPEGWAFAWFRHVVDFQEGPGILAIDFVDEGVPLMRVAGVQGRWATLDGCNYLDPSKVEKRWSHFRLAAGDLIISASATMGTVCEVSEAAVGAVPYTGLIRLKPRGEEITRDYIRAFVCSWPFSTQIDQLKAGATIQHFGPTHLAQVWVPLPPRQEQEELAKHIAQQHQRYDELTATAENAIALLQERRTALISAAVTGKIDVRDLVSAETEAA